MEICHNCGLPEGALRNPGRTASVTAAAQFGDKRSRRHSVWCCTDECAIQSLAISKYGKSSFRWPITLAQFRAMNPLEESRKKRAPNKAYLERLTTEKSVEITC